MGQTLFNPEDAKGWDWGDAWMNTGTRLRARYALEHARVQPRLDAARVSTRTALLSGQDASTADKVVDLLADRLNVSDVSADVRAAWIDYMNANDDGSRGAWTNTPANVDKKVRGLVAPDADEPGVSPRLKAAKTEEDCHADFSRRDFLLRSAGFVTVSAMVPRWAVAGASNSRSRSARRRPDRTLVVLELMGGNDGLNTVIPYADSALSAGAVAHRHPGELRSAARRQAGSESGR